MSLQARHFTLLAVALAAIAVTRVAHAQPKAPAPNPACKLVGLPLVEGTEWVFEAMAPPGVTPSATPPAKPKQPAKVTIKVASVTTTGTGKDQVTTIKLEEAADARAYTSELTCKKDQLFVPPQSFLFSGEPGGGLNITLGAVERTPDSRASYEFFQGKMRVPEWIENLKTTFSRQPAPGTKVKLGDGVLDLQRIIKIGLPEPVNTKLGTFDATPLQVDLRGSVTVAFEAEPKEFNIPANTISKLWFAENVGPVQVYNTNGHFYQLTAVNKLEAAQPQPAQPQPAK